MQVAKIIPSVHCLSKSNTCATIEHMLLFHFNKVMYGVKRFHE